MDPVTLIVSALAAGAAESLKGTAGQASSDAYQGLKTLIQRRFAGGPEAEVALTQHEQNSAVWQEPLKDALTKTTADQDRQIVDAARKLLETLDPDGSAAGKYQVEFKGTVQGVIVGDRAQQTNTFDASG